MTKTSSRGAPIIQPGGRLPADVTAAPHLLETSPSSIAHSGRFFSNVTVDDELMTIDEWCAHNRISRRTYYNLQREGQGPELTRIRGAVRISRQANRCWQKRMSERRP
jgi:hypothetical protein